MVGNIVGVKVDVAEGNGVFVGDAVPVGTGLGAEVPFEQPERKNNKMTPTSALRMRLSYILTVVLQSMQRDGNGEHFCISLISPQIEMTPIISYGKNLLNEKTMNETMMNKNVIVTGGSSGIGFETAHALAGMDASVWIVGRDEARSKAAVAKIKEFTGNEKVEYLLADLSSIHSVDNLGQEIHSKLDRLDVLVNNAGAFFMRRKVTADGLEMTFALNHVNYFLLTSLLMDLIKKSGNGRIVNVSSAAHYSGHVDFSDLQLSRGFNPMRAYGTSKLMNVLFTYELNRRLNGDGITVNALHPGFVASNFGRSNGGLLDPIFKIVQLGAISTEQGAKTSVYLASSPDVEGVSGKYFDKCEAVRSSSESYDPEIAARLWTETELLIKSRS